MKVPTVFSDHLEPDLTGDEFTKDNLFVFRKEVD